MKRKSVVMVKGTNCSGKSTLVLELRRKGWREIVYDSGRKEGGTRICYTKFAKPYSDKRVIVLGKYGEKGGGCDGLTKDECLETLNHVWPMKHPVYFEGQNIADTLTTHPMYMMMLNGVKTFSFKTRGTVPTPKRDWTKKRKRAIKVVCLDVPIDVILKRLKKRTPDKVLKNNAAKTRQKHASVKRQYGEMKSWPEVTTGKVQVIRFENTGTKQELVKFMYRQLGLSSMTAK